MYAVVSTGGKQYRVAEGDLCRVEKLDAEEGAAGLDEVTERGSLRLRQDVATHLEPDHDVEGRQPFGIMHGTVLGREGAPAPPLDDRRQRGYALLDRFREYRATAVEKWLDRP